MNWIIEEYVSNTFTIEIIDRIKELALEFIEEEEIEGTKEINIDRTFGYFTINFIGEEGFNIWETVEYNILSVIM